MNRTLAIKKHLKESQYLKSLKDPKVLLSTLGFQLVWWQLIVLASQGYADLGSLVSLCYVCFHVFAIARKRWRQELLFILLFGFLGWFGDAILSLLSIQKFQTDHIVPFWLLCLWLNYMTSIHYSMAQVFYNRFLTLLIGFIFGPWTYWACAKIGLVDFPRSALLAGLIQGFVWMGWMWAYRTVFKRQIFYGDTL
jgi:hypothetical protein